MSVAWGEIFGISTSPLELIIRGTAMYLFLFLIFRLVSEVAEAHMESDGSVSVIKNSQARGA